MSITRCTQAALDAASNSLRPDEPVYMVNMLRYRDRAEYQDGSDLPPCSGREAYYKRYAVSFNEIGRGQGYRIFWRSDVGGVLVGVDGEVWDEVLIVHYDSFSTLRRILENPEYDREAVPHQKAALAGWKFLVTTQAAPL